MRETTEIFIPIPKTRNNQIKIELNGNDVTGRVNKSSFVLPVTNGIGTFDLKLSNNQDETYSVGDVVKFFADNKDATTTQFWGRVDHIEDDITKEGNFLSISGRHRSYQATEFLICYNGVGPTSTILKDIIDKLPASYGFTYANVATTTDSMTVEWNYKPFWDCVIELCNYSGMDCYVDNDLDFHYFVENSILNETDAIVEGDNLLNSRGWGIDDYYEKTRVTVIGESIKGLPIIYTDISSSEGDDIREVFIRDLSSNTEEKVKNLAEAKLIELSNRTPQATIKSFGLETIKPGDNLWILITRQKIYGQYKAVKIIHKFGTSIGGWRTELLTEHEEEKLSEIINNLDRKSDRVSTVENPNKFNYSWNFEFDEDSGTHSGTEIIDGVLKTTGAETGTWVSDLRELDEDVSSVEIRGNGQSLPGTVLYISLDGITFRKIKARTFSVKSGNKMKVKVKFNSSATQIYDIVVLFS